MTKRKTKTAPEARTEYVTLTLPVLIPPPGEKRACVRNVQVQNLRPIEQRALRALFDGLVFDGATVTTSMDRPIQHLACDPVRYLLQQLAEAAGL